MLRAVHWYSLFCNGGNLHIEVVKARKIEGPEGVAARTKARPFRADSRLTVSDSLSLAFVVFFPFAVFEC